MSQNIAHFGVFPIKKSINLQKSVHGAFLSHFDIVNVTVDSQFTIDRALLMFLCSHMCLDPQGCGARGVVRCGYCESTLPLDRACSAECQQLQLCSIAAPSYVQYSKSACSVCTVGCVL